MEEDLDRKVFARDQIEDGGTNQNRVSGSFLFRDFFCEIMVLFLLPGLLYSHFVGSGCPLYAPVLLFFADQCWGPLRRKKVNQAKVHIQKD